MSVRIMVSGICLCIAACASEGGEHDGHSGHEEAEFEGCPESIPAFSLGMSTASADGGVKAVLREASPAPPARFFNDWTVEFAGADDNPLDDIELRSVRAFMPVHGHYGTPDPRLRRREDEPAVFDLERLNLFMRGPWEVKLVVSSPSAGDAELIFDVCVEE